MNSGDAVTIRSISLSLVALLLIAAVGCENRVSTNVPVKMRDGVNLLTDIYLPPGNGPFPTVICRVPYGTQTDYVFQPAVGLSTTPLVDLASHALAVSPDVIVLYAGHNEFYGVGGVATNANINQLGITSRLFKLSYI